MTEQQLIDEEYTNGKKSFDYVWHQVCENFDFNKVFTVMKALDWSWHFKDERCGIPTPKTIMETARTMMFESYNDGFQCSSGGFTVGWDSGEMYLVFQLEEFQTLVNVSKEPELV